MSAIYWKYLLKIIQYSEGEPLMQFLYFTDETEFWTNGAEKYSMSCKLTKRRKISQLNTNGYIYLHLSFCLLFYFLKIFWLSNAGAKGSSHKVLAYVEYRAVSGVFQNIDPPPPSPPSACVLPPHQRRGILTRRTVRGVGASIFWRTPYIGLASYSIISLRV